MIIQLKEYLIEIMIFDELESQLNIQYFYLVLLFCINTCGQLNLHLLSVFYHEKH